VNLPQTQACGIETIRSSIRVRIALRAGPDFVQALWLVRAPAGPASGSQYYSSSILMMGRATVKKLKVNFVIYIADRKASTCI